MGQAYLVRRGGGAKGKMNFDIVGGTEQPGSAKENTIWIRTDKAITGWHIGAQAPETAEEGMVFIMTGTASNAAFDAVEENTLMVYPKACYQYEDGTWTLKEAASYQGGAWTTWAVVMIKDGVLVQDMQVRGGRWVSNDDYTSNNPALTQESGYVLFKGTKSGYGMAYMENVDLTGRTEIVIEGTFTPRDYVRLCVWSQLGTYLGSYIASYAMLTATGARIDLGEEALTGPYIVGVTSQASYEQKITALYVR